MSGPTTHPSNRPADPSDPRIRRSWWLLAATFALLGLVALGRLVLGGEQPLDWLTAGLVVCAGLAATIHRKAVASLEASRRGEAESFARILTGLSRSVSPDAVVEAIVEELAESTGADHVVVVRRRTDARVLEATLVSSRAGVPSTTTTLPFSDLEEPVVRRSSRRDRGGLVGIPIEPRLATARGEPVMAGRAAVSVLAGPAEGALRQGPDAPPGTRAGEHPEVPPGGSVDVGPGRGVLRTTSVPGPLPGGWRDIGGLAWGKVVAFVVGSSGGSERPVESSDPHDPSSAVATRIGERVRGVYGLRDVIAAPLAADGEVVGAIVLSRRVADPWPATARRLLSGAAHEASMALSRAYSHRAAEARASTDSLTGLPNRRYFDEFCGLLARRRRADDAVGVLMIDIDRFKVLNDTYGHGVGDEVLRAVGGAIVAAVREDDVPARFGGEEFVVLLRNPSPAVAAEVGERVRQAVSSLDLGAFGVPGVSVSVGVAVAEVPDQPIEDLVASADAALYRAKRAGRDRVVSA